VTFEPFRNPNGETDLQVLQNVTEGKYDREISHLFSILNTTIRKVYLRYAHEMEIPITRYPWQSQNPVTYIKSFRYFMNFQDSLSPNINRVWGPAGDRGSIEWWPGNDVVDFMSIAIYGLPDKNITDPEKQESFTTIFNRKYWRLRFIDKPIFITEFGVKGPEDFQNKWLEEAAKTINKNPQIIGINYFNMSDTPGAWGDIKAPDWSITPKTLHRFLDVLIRDDD
jgi:beta-mannanase